LPDIVDADVVGAFLSGTTCHSLVHKLGCLKPKTTKDLLDPATNHASGEEAVKAIFEKAKAKEPNNQEEGTSTQPEKKKRTKPWKRRGDNFVAMADRPPKQRAKAAPVPKAAPATGSAPPATARPPSDFFEKMIEKTCPNHGYPVPHTFKNCNLLKRFL
jgi:hypothetical protein